MMLHMYALKNRLSGIYERPITEKFDDKEYVEFLCASLAMASVEDLSRHKEFDVYKVGSYESKSGVITSCDPVFVCSLEDICLNFINAKVKKNERSEEAA